MFYWAVSGLGKGEVPHSGSLPTDLWRGGCIQKWGVWGARDDASMSRWCHTAAQKGDFGSDL